MLIARRDDVAKHAAADGADDKARGSVVARAVIAPVAPAIDAVVMAQAARLVGPPVAVVAIGIPGFPRVLGALAVGGRPGEIGRAHVRTPVTNAHLVCRLLLEKKNPANYDIYMEHNLTDDSTPKADSTQQTVV